MKRGFIINRIAKFFLIIPIILLSICQPAHADAVLPMLFALSPGLGVFFVPIVLLEAFVALRILNISYTKGLKLSGLANLISTIVGIPVTWLLINIDGRTWGDFVKSFLPDFWSGGGMIYLAPILLCVPLFFISVWVEYFVVVKVYGRDMNHKLLLKWSWLANLWSYGLIILGFLSLLTHHFEAQSQFSIR